MIQERQKSMHIKANDKREAQQGSQYVGCSKMLWDHKFFVFEKL